METIHSWALGLCAAAVVGSAAAVLTPSGTFEKSIKTVISVFLICALIMPLFKENSALQSYLSINLDEAVKVDESISEQIYMQTEKYFKNTVSEILKKNGISFKDIVIEIEAAEDTVNVKSVTVISPDREAQAVRDILKNEAGIDADVVTQ